MEKSKTKQQAEEIEALEADRVEAEAGANAELEAKADAEASVSESLELSFYVQYQGKEVPGSDILDRIKEDYQKLSKAGKERLREVNCYIKPEEEMVYYVVNGEIKGRVAL